MPLKRYRGNECQTFAPDHLWCRACEVEQLEKECALAAEALERCNRMLGAALKAYSVVRSA